MPASSANLGPGFDTLAVALRLYLRLRVCAVLDGPTNGLQFDLCGTRLGGDNYVERSFRAVADGRAARSSRRSRSRCAATSPSREASAAAPRRPWRGCCSTSASPGPREGRDLLTLATALDEHADNVAAALLGGLVTTCVPTTAA